MRSEAAMAISEQERAEAIARLRAFQAEAVASGITEEEILAALKEDKARGREERIRRDQEERRQRTGSASTPAS